MAALGSARTALTILGMHTTTPEVFWHGAKLNHVVRVRGHSDEDGAEVTIRVNDPTGAQDQIYAEMVLAGIRVKKGN